MTSKLKVLHVLNSVTGGAALSTLELIRELRRYDVDSVVVSDDIGTAADRAHFQAETAGNALFTTLYWWNRKIRVPLWRRPLVELNQLRRTGWLQGSTRRVANFAAQQQVQLIHTSTFITPEGSLAAEQLGLPHVWHVRELVGPNSPYPLSMWGSQLRAAVVRTTQKVVANSQASAAPLRTLLPPELVEVIPNGINLSQFTPRKTYKRPGSCIVGMVGNLTSPVKNHALFIEAAAQVSRQLAVEFRIYGHDPSRGGQSPGGRYIDHLHRLIAQHSVGDRFTWPGHVPSPAAIMEELDLLVHPSDVESFGRIVVEAMAAGLPVIGMAGGGVAGIVQPGTTGLLVPPSSSRELAGAIEQVVSDVSLRECMGRAGRQVAEDTYSMETCARRIFATYSDVQQSWAMRN